MSFKVEHPLQILNVIIALGENYRHNTLETFSAKKDEMPIFVSKILNFKLNTQYYVCFILMFIAK